MFDSTSNGRRGTGAGYKESDDGESDGVVEMHIVSIAPFFGTSVILFRRSRTNALHGSFSKLYRIYNFASQNPISAPLQSTHDFEILHTSYSI
jgi:hypothetical protein